MLLIVVAACFALLLSCGGVPPLQVGQVLDEARSSGRSAQSFPAAGEDYFHDMDGGIPLSPEEIKGRNTWLVWSGGNDRFWDGLSATSGGVVDFLKTISSHPSLKFSRDTRWNYFGLVNEPCFGKATGPDPERYGLWLDKRRVELPTSHIKTVGTHTVSVRLHPEVVATVDVEVVAGD